MPPLPEPLKRSPRARQALAEWLGKILVAAAGDRESWKMPLRGAFKAEDIMSAAILAAALVNVCGGAWVIESEEETPEGRKKVYYVWSKGYYHYVGA